MHLFIDPAHIAVLLAFLIIAAFGETVSRRRVMPLREAAEKGLLR